VLHVTLAASAFMNAELDRRAEATKLLDELLGRWGDSRPASPGAILAAAWAAGALGRSEEIGALLARFDRPTRWMVAAAHVSAGELCEAADVCASMPSLPDEAYARLRAAEQLVAEGRRAEADEQLAGALAFYRAVGASRYVREGEALLAATA
jgi:thioredoxin-like negative regulator of GroEL